MSSWLGKIGVPSSEFVIFDGCGLSRKDGISPHTLNTVLKHMAGPSINGPYLQLLRRYSPVNKTDAWFAFKTGSMDTARSVSGVLETIGGQYCAVTIMVNGHRESVSALKGEIDSLVGILDSIKSIKFESAKPSAPKVPPANQTKSPGSGVVAPTKAGATAPAGGATTTANTPGAGAGGQTDAATGEVTMVELSRGGPARPGRTVHGPVKSHRRRH